MRAISIPMLIAYCLAAGILSLAGCQPAGEPETTGEPAAEATTAADDEAAIRAIGDSYASAWADGDAAAVANLYASDGDSVGVDGRFLKGRAEIQAALAEDLEGFFKGTQISITTDSVRFLEPSVAMMDGSFEITGITGPDGAAADPLRGLFSNIGVKEGGTWTLGCVRAMVPLPAPLES